MIFKALLSRFFSATKTPSKNLEQVIISSKNQISIDKAKVKQAFQKTNAKVQSLTKANETLTEENTTIKAELNKLQSEYRHDVIAAMHQGCGWFKSDKDVSRSIQSFEKSGMSIKDIKAILDQLRDSWDLLQQQHTKVQHGTTKLPQKSTPTENKRDSFIE